MADPLKLEAGGFYRQRNGEIVGPLEAITHNPHAVFKFRTNGHSWREDGYWDFSGELRERDLVEKVSPPGTPMKADDCFTLEDALHEHEWRREREKWRRELCKRADQIRELKVKVDAQADDARRKDDTIRSLKGTIRAKQKSIATLAEALVRAQGTIEKNGQILEAQRAKACALQNRLDAVQAALAGRGNDGG